MNQQVQQWYNEKPAFDGSRLDFKTNDVVVFNFAANGDEGDRFIKIYQAHILPSLSKNGVPFTEQRYCMQRNDGERCEFCEAGHNDIKERMSMWLYVRNWLHHQQPKEKQFPAVPYEGNVFFNEEINDFRNWEASAWRESPWSDICRLAEMYKGLHNFTAQMVTTGSQLTKRHKLYAIPNSESFPSELYEKAKETLTSIPELLRGKASSPIQLRPEGTGATAAKSVSTPNFQPTGINTMAPAPSFGTPAPASNTLSFLSPNLTPAAPSDPNAEVGYTPPEGEEQKRPMRSLF